MPYNRFIIEDLESLQNEVNSLYRLMFEDAVTHGFFAEGMASREITRQLDRIRLVIGDLKERVQSSHAEPDEVEQKEVAVYLFFSIQTLDAQFQATLTATSSPQASKKEKSARAGFRAWFKQHVWPQMQKVLGRFWQVLSGLMTPKEWTLGAGVSILGLTNATIGIKFEP